MKSAVTAKNAQRQAAWPRSERNGAAIPGSITSILDKAQAISSRIGLEFRRHKHGHLILISQVAVGFDAKIGMKQ